MSPLDQRKEVPNLKEDGEGSVQVKMDPNMKIDGAKVFAVYGKGALASLQPHRIYLLLFQS